MADARRRKWYNEFNKDLVATTQEVFVLTTTGFDKGETLVRMLLSLSLRVVTINVNVNFAVAVWVGNFGGIPTSLFADSSEGYMMWDVLLLRNDSASGPAVVHRTWDLRGQRAARSDTDQVHFVMQAEVSQNVDVTLASRCLTLLP